MREVEVAYLMGCTYAFGVTPRLFCTVIIQIPCCLDRGRELYLRLFRPLVMKVAALLPLTGFKGYKPGCFYACVAESYTCLSAVLYIIHHYFYNAN